MLVDSMPREPSECLFGRYSRSWNGELCLEHYYCEFIHAGDGNAECSVGQRTFHCPFLRRGRVKKE